MSEYVFGVYGKDAFLVMMTWMLIGALLRKLTQLSRRKPSSPLSPRKFSPVYWLQDNWSDMAIGFILAIITVRWPDLYLKPLISLVMPANETLDALFLGSLLAGLGIDIIAERISKLANLK